jgi:hypothetical protein
MEKNPDPRSGIWDNYSGPFFESLLTIFVLQIFKFFVADPDLGFGAFLSPGSGMEKSGCVMFIPDQRHCGILKHFFSFKCCCSHRLEQDLGRVGDR